MRRATSAHAGVRLMRLAGAASSLLFILSDICPATTAECTPVAGPDNDNCSAATPVGEGSFPFDTTTATNDGTASCGSSATSPDVWFEYTPSDSGNATFDTCASGYDTVLSLHTSCESPDLLCNDDLCDRQSVLYRSVTAGVPVLIRVSGFDGAVGAGSLQIALHTGPCITIPPGAIAEPETCGQSTNAGCGADPVVATPIACEDSVHGTAWAEDSFRDTDWYEFSVTNPDTVVTWEGTAEFALRLFLLTGNCAPTIIDTAAAPPCTLVSLTATLQPGTYFAFASDNGFDGNPCGGMNNDYWVRLSCLVACAPDFNDDGMLNSQDFFDFLAAFFAADPSADFNHDNQINSQDFFDFLGAFFAGC